MIEKNRLEELIEQGATVYMANRYTEGIFLDKRNFEVTDKELIFKYKIYAVLLEDLFETKEDAEEYAEFGNITRTERLELPSWEEFANGKIVEFVSNKLLYFIFSNIVIAINIDIIRPTGTTMNENNAVFPIASWNFGSCNTTWKFLNPLNCKLFNVPFCIDIMNVFIKGKTLNTPIIIKAGKRYNHACGKFSALYLNFFISIL